MILSKLLQEIELAPCGSHGLDSAIAAALDVAASRSYSRSLDAAFGLLPDGWSLHQLSHHNDCNGHFTGWSAELYQPTDGIVLCPSARQVASAPLAVCAAVLRVHLKARGSDRLLTRSHPWFVREPDHKLRALQ
jgi:hypothetical protein